MEEIITPTMTVEQIRAIVEHLETPVRVIDPTTKRTFVLLAAETYATVRAILNDEFDIRDTYAAQFSSALPAGWDDPEMEAYDTYEENFKRSCQSRAATSS